MGILHAFDLRNFGWLVNFSFLVADAEPKAVGEGRVMGGDFGEVLIVPPKGAGLGEAVTKMAGILQGQPGGREAAQTQSADEMAARLKARDLLLQPGKDFFDDEAAKRVVAGVVLLSGGHIEMIEKGEGDGRQRMAVEQGLEHGKDFHLLQIKFAVEKETEPVGLSGGAAQQMEGTGITQGRIR